MNSSNFFVAMSDIINNLKVYGIYGEDEAWFTRKQIGELLEYESPVNSISMIHNRHKERLDAVSKEIHISFPQGGQQNVFVYSLKGVLEICRWSKQPKADMVMDALYDMAEKVLKRGYFSSMSDEELFTFLANEIKKDREVYKRVIAPVLADSRMDMRSVILEYAFAIGYDDFPYHQSQRMAAFESERTYRAFLFSMWEDKPYKNHFTYDEIPEWVKERIKQRSFATDRKFYGIFKCLYKHDKKDRYEKNFHEFKGYHFTREGYERIIDYAVSHHIVFPDEAEKWRKEAGLTGKKE